MKIEYITLSNFRQYFGEHTIHFASNPDRNVTIIHGVNGAGKTSLCVALNWCLYGDEFIQEKYGQIGELASKHHLVRIMGEGTSVKVGFTYQNERYIAERCFTTPEETSFNLIKEEGTLPFDEADVYDNIELMIPKEVSIHFFFDGEKINNFALEGNEKDVRDAVCNVLKIEVINRSIKHLTDVKNDYASELNKMRNEDPGSRLQILRDKKVNLESERKSKSDFIATMRQDIVSAKNQIKDVDQKLEKNESSRKLAEDRIKIESELKQFIDNKSRIEENIRALAIQGFIPIAKPVVDKALNILNTVEVPSIPKTVLNELLQQMHCLCGRSIKQDSQEHQKLSSMLEVIGDSNSSPIVNETLDSLKYISRTHIKDIPEGLKDALNENHKLVQDIASHNSKLSAISKKLEGFDEINVRNLQRNRDRSLTKIGELRQLIRESQDAIEKIDKDHNKIREEIKSAETSEDNFNKLSRYEVLTEDTLKAMKTIKDIFAENMREKVEPKVECLFKQLVWKSSSFKNVRLSEKFELEVIDSFGEAAKPELSAGERQVLSLAFIMAMAEVAAEEMPLDIKNEPYPIIMDTPFGRLSKEPIKNITATLPEIAEQLILFVTDTELSDDAIKNLKSRIGKEYYLQFDQDNSYTTINLIE